MHSRSTYSKLCEDFLADLLTTTRAAKKFQTYIPTKTYELCEDFLAQTMRQTRATLGFSPWVTPKLLKCIYVLHPCILLSCIAHTLVFTKVVYTVPYVQSQITCHVRQWLIKPLTHMAYFSKAAFPAALLTPTKAMCSQKQCALKHHSLHRLFVIILSSFVWQEGLPCCHHC